MRRCLFFLIAILGFSLAAQVAGEYSGSWKSGTSGDGGKLNLRFSDTALATASFTLQGHEVKTKPVSYKADGNNLDFVFEYDLDGNLLRSRMQGSLSGATMKGKYQSAPAAGGAPVDEGTWEVTQQ